MLFRHPNVMIILLACLMVIIGLSLMTGESTTESSFSQDVFSMRRIVVAPLICLGGYLLVIVGIAWRFDK